MSKTKLKFETIDINAFDFTDRKNVQSNIINLCNQLNNLAEDFKTIIKITKVNSANIDDMAKLLKINLDPSESDDSLGIEPKPEGKLNE